MKETLYDKLVRDRIPEIIEKDGRRPVAHIATDEEYVRKLVEKLSEETAELAKNPSAEELADVLEVIHAFCKLYGFDMKDIERERLRKRDERGRFDKRIILDKVVE